MASVPTQAIKDTEHSGWVWAVGPWTAGVPVDKGHVGEPQTAILATEDAPPLLSVLQIFLRKVTPLCLKCVIFLFLSVLKQKWCRTNKAHLLPCISP